MPSPKEYALILKLSEKLVKAGTIVVAVAILPPSLDSNWLNEMVIDHLAVSKR